MSADNRGTPKTFDEAVAVAVEAGIEYKTDHRVVMNTSAVAAHVKDFLAQRFGAALLSQNPGEAAAAQKIWDLIMQGGR